MGQIISNKREQQQSASLNKQIEIKKLDVLYSLSPTSAMYKCWLSPQSIILYLLDKQSILYQNKEVMPMNMGKKQN